MDGVNHTSAAYFAGVAGWSVKDNQSDFSGDGKSDLLWTNIDGSAIVWQMDGVNHTAAQYFEGGGGWVVA
jgi:hypothetical protein